MNGLDILACAYLPMVPDTDCTIAVVDNFSGDQKADILWRNSASGELYVWLMNGTKVAERGSLYTVPIDWQIVAVGDVYGEGMADVVWRNATTGEDYL